MKMLRAAGKKSESGMYHIILRGINRQGKFKDDEVEKKLLKYEEKCGYNINAYCFMSNHFHLLLNTGKKPLKQIMRRIREDYVYWYIKK
ncbi:MAG: transposase [Dehalobacterium sp.]